MVDPNLNWSAFTFKLISNYIKYKLFKHINKKIEIARIKFRNPKDPTIRETLFKYNDIARWEFKGCKRY